MRRTRERPQETGRVTASIRRLLCRAATPDPERYAAFVRLRTFGRATTARPRKPAPANDDGMPVNGLRNAGVLPPLNWHRRTA